MVKSEVPKKLGFSLAFREQWSRERSSFLLLIVIKIISASGIHDWYMISFFYSVFDQRNPNFLINHFNYICA